MKLPDVYSDWRVVFGLALLILGIGNWVVGWEKAQLYAQLAATESKSDGHGEPSYRSFDELGSAVRSRRADASGVFVSRLLLIISMGVFCAARIKSASGRFAAPMLGI